MRDMVERSIRSYTPPPSALEDLANTDPLTGLANRAFLNHYLQHTLPRGTSTAPKASSYCSSISMAF
ncbi:hypothetical protein DK37_23645 [Halomonas sp. SUBG004]|nr:hypothetical protein DK37_23645 [Halomonas sp. SUBG004]